MSFDDDLLAAGFQLLQSDRDGTRRYTRRSNPYLQWWVMVFPGGMAQLTWEFELGSYLYAKGFHVAVHDELSLLMFPPGEVTGPADAGWLADEITGAEAKLASLDFVTGE